MKKKKRGYLTPERYQQYKKRREGIDSDFIQGIAERRANLPGEDWKRWLDENSFSSARQAVLDQEYGVPNARNRRAAASREIMKRWQKRPWTPHYTQEQLRGR